MINSQTWRFSQRRFRDILIRITDKIREAGWAAIYEYLSDDENQIRAAEQRALKEKKNAFNAKSGQKLSIFVCCDIFLLFFALPGLRYLSFSGLQVEYYGLLLYLFLSNTINSLLLSLLCVL